MTTAEPILSVLWVARVRRVDIRILIRIYCAHAHTSHSLDRIFNLVDDFHSIDRIQKKQMFVVRV